MSTPYSSPIDTIMFDYGGVVSDHYCEPFQTQMAEIFGTTHAEARKLVSESSPHGRAYRLGQMSKEEFWAQVKKLSGKGFDDDELQLLWAKTYIINVAMVSMLQFLKEKKSIQVGIALNDDYARWQYIVETYKPETFSTVNVVSCEIGALKPEQVFYEKMLIMCGRRDMPDRVLCVDDRQTHVDAAISAGLQGYLYTNEGELSKAAADHFNLIPFEP
jgi:FMN phosphatase YigB (HAD superfamily)